MSNMSKGLFITFEGTDGCGKSTQIQLFADYLKSIGREVVVTREPGGTDISERIREIILDPNAKEEDPLTEMFLFAAARAQHVAQLIKPSVEAGKIVLCDRFVDSSIAYQGYARGLGDQVRIINEYAVSGCVPNITFFFDISAEESKKRNSFTDKADRMELEKLDFHQQVYQGFKELAENNKDRFVVIDASKSIEEIQKNLQDIFNARASF